MINQFASVQAHSTEVFKSSIVFTTLATIAVVLRVWTKSRTKAKSGVDDGLIVAAMFLWYGQTACQIYGTIVARRSQNIMDSNFEEYLKMMYIAGEFYPPLLLCINLSILTFYRRVFPVEEFRRLANAIIIISILWFIACMGGETFMCWPISAMWADLIHAPTACKDYGLFFVIMMSLELGLDVMILALPISQVLKLRMSWQTRTMLAGIFLLGGFSIITGIVRIILTYHRGEQFIDLVVDMVWLDIHVGTAIICACLPTFRPLARASAAFISSSIRRVYGSGYGSKRSGASSLPQTGERDASYPSKHSQPNFVKVETVSETSVGVYDDEIGLVRV